MSFRPSKERPQASAGIDGSYNPMMDGNALRNDLHSFVFIHGSEQLVYQLIRSPWNRSLKFPMIVWRDGSGRLIRVPDREMELFKNAIRKQDFQVCVGQPLDDIRTGDKVVVVDGPMKDSNGVVTAICERKGRITLTISFWMFNDMMQIAVPGFQIVNVRLEDRKADQLLHDSVISNFENELIELLCHRHGGKGSAELSIEDRKQLTFLHKYRDIVFEDNDDSKAKFSALMLICSYLMKDDGAIVRYRQQVEEWLQGRTEPSDDLDCYLLTALFIVNHDVALRQKLKSYRQSHPDCPLPIRRLLSIAKKIKIR
jgi:ribosomal protein L24